MGALAECLHEGLGCDKSEEEEMRTARVHSVHSDAYLCVQRRCAYHRCLPCAKQCCLAVCTDVANHVQQRSMVSSVHIGAAHLLRTGIRTGSAHAAHYVQCIKWLHAAASLGSEEAQRMLDESVLRMSVD